MTLSRDKKARRETGGPSSLAHRVGGQGEASDTEASINALEALTTSELRILWQQLYRVTPPTRLSRDLLLRGIAYKVQERAYGALSLSIRRRLLSLGDGSNQRGGAGGSPAVVLKPGTKLVREWHGHLHTVGVLDDGFEYQGEHYESLTRIARRITGAAWSGPRFFGIAKTGGTAGSANE
jgi:hypothetical protein